ncbi:MAG: hypothetical protein AB7S38_15270 [Vulcanimicrobiota bacterium]
MDRAELDGMRSGLIQLVMVGLAAAGLGWWFSPPPASDIQIVQQGRRQTVSPGGVIHLRRGPFKLVFPLRAYHDGEASIRVAGAASPPPDIGSGGPFTEDETFGEARGLAAAGEYDPFYLSWQCHHYVIYAPREPDTSRATLEQDLGKGLYQVSWTIKHFARWEMDSDDQQLLETVPNLYVRMLDDRDTDGVIDPGEVVDFEVRWDD